MKSVLSFARTAVCVDFARVYNIHIHTYTRPHTPKVNANGTKVGLVVNISDDSGMSVM